MITSYRPSDLCSIIVTYKTKIYEFTDILKKHQNNFQQVIIVNNSPEIDLLKFQSKQVTLITNPGNIGLSAALNVGIKAAKRLGFKMVGLFDQDTELPPNFTQQMLHYINRYQGDEPIAVYSSIFHNHVIKET